MQTKLTSQLKTGGLAVIPTDTIFGIVCGALDKEAVAKVYKLKKRSPTKPVIILIGRIKDLELFSIQLSTVQKHALVKYWPGKVSIVLPCKNKAFRYLHRGTNTLAFRLPKKKSLLALLKKTGPLIAPSANPEGLPPATNLKEAKAYFGDTVAYLGGKASKKASKIIKLSENGEVTVLRA